MWLYVWERNLRAQHETEQMCPISMAPIFKPCSTDPVTQIAINRSATTWFLIPLPLSRSVRLHGYSEGQQMMGHQVIQISLCQLPDSLSPDYLVINSLIHSIHEWATAPPEWPYDNTQYSHPKKTTLSDWIFRWCCHKCLSPLGKKCHQDFYRLGSLLGRPEGGHLRIIVDSKHQLYKSN